MARANQRELFGERKPVQKPGSRGGRFYITENGLIRYGERPEGRVLDPEGGVEMIGQQAHVARLSSFRSRQVAGPGDVADIFRSMASADRERFWVLHLDDQSRPTAVELGSVGSINASIVHPREVLKNVLAMGTPRIALLHNHPSGKPGLSREDVDITDRVKLAASQMGVSTLFHVVVGREGWSWYDPGVGMTNAFSTAYEVTPWTGRERPTGPPIPEVEGELVERSEPLTPLYRRALKDANDAATLGRTLLEPGEATAVLVALDNKHIPVGVFPIAHGADELRSTGLARTLRMAVRASAAATVIVAGEDHWNEQLWQFTRDLDAASTNVGIKLLDAVMVRGDGTAVSAQEVGILK